MTTTGVTYASDIDPSSGRYSMDYPRQKANTRLSFTFTDVHGCSYTLDANVRNTLEDKTMQASNIFPARASASVDAGVRVVAQVGGVLYKSDFASEDGDYVTVTYPQQSIGSSVSAWLESENSSFSAPVKRKFKHEPYAISGIAYNDHIAGAIFIHDDFQSAYSPYPDSVYVEIKGKRYPCETYNSSYYRPHKHGEAESGSYSDRLCIYEADYPNTKPDRFIKVILIDPYGHVTSESVYVDNTPPKLTVSQITSDSTKVTGKTKAKRGSKVTVKVGGKTYRTKVKKNGKFAVKIKKTKAGKSFYIRVEQKDFNYNEKYGKVKQATSSLSFTSDIFTSSRSVTVSVTNVKKGDTIRLSAGAYTYEKKLTSSKKRQNITLNLPSGLSAGTTLDVTLYDWSKRKKGSYDDMIYSGNSIYTGMSANDALLTTWGYPIRRNDWGNGYQQWVFQSGISTLYVYIRNGRVESMNRYHF